MYQPEYFCGTWRDLMQRESATFSGDLACSPVPCNAFVSAKACGHATKCGFVLPDWETSIGLRCLRPYRPRGVARRLARARLRRLKGLDGAGSTQPGIGPHTDPGTGPLALRTLPTNPSAGG